LDPSHLFCVCFGVSCTHQTASITINVGGSSTICMPISLVMLVAILCVQVVPLHMPRLVYPHILFRPSAVGLLRPFSFTSATTPCCLPLCSSTILQIISLLLHVHYQHTLPCPLPSLCPPLPIYALPFFISLLSPSLPFSLFTVFTLQNIFRGHAAEIRARPTFHYLRQQSNTTLSW
jgi:hypothetical protein